MARRTYKQRLIENYYKNLDSIMLQTLGEIVSELYLTGDEFKKRRLWKKAENALRKLGVKDEEISRLVQSRDTRRLAEFVGKKF